jgi:hypothetical protein
MLAPKRTNPDTGCGLDGRDHEMASLTPPLAPPINELRLARLISHGYFPAELPPPFTADGFSQHVVEFSQKWDPKDIRNFWSAPESFGSPRYGHARRKISIVNPINQTLVALIVSDNWDDIKKRLSRSKISEFQPEILLKGRGRAVTGVNFDGVSRRKAEILGSFGRYVRTDIARFYPSIYTHSIAWALVGKQHAKADHQSAAFKNSYPNQLDAAVRAGQEGQTLGIPIGPDTSRILSELIAVEIEIILKSKLIDLEVRGVRYVDDMILGLKDAETASVVLSGLSTALYEYGLELNADKTVTLGMGSPHAPEWIHYIRTFELSAKASRQRDDLDSFFEQAVYLADANPRENALLFAVKRAATFAVDSKNLDHLVRWLLYSARRAPSCLRFVSEHLAAINSTSKLPHDEICAYIVNQIPQKAEAAHIEELAWLLFWAREIAAKIPADALTGVRLLQSSTIALLVMDLNQLGLIDGALDISFWESFATVEGLKSDMWLAAYEATRKGWWPAADAYVKNHEFFGDIWAKGIEFYDVSKKARPSVTPTFLAKLLASSEYGAGTYPF